MVMVTTFIAENRSISAEVEPSGAAAFCQVWQASNAQERAYEDAKGMKGFLQYIHVPDCF